MFLFSRVRHRGEQQQTESSILNMAKSQSVIWERSCKSYGELLLVTQESGVRRRAEHCDRGMQVSEREVSVARAGHRSGASDQCDLLLSEERELSQLVGGGGERVRVRVAEWSVCVNDGNPPGPPPPTAFPCRGSVLLRCRAEGLCGAAHALAASGCASGCAAWK